MTNIPEVSPDLQHAYDTDPVFRGKIDEALASPSVTYDRTRRARRPSNAVEHTVSLDELR